MKNNDGVLKMNVGFKELIFILIIVLLIFGAKKVPELARALGKGIRDFKKGIEGIEEEDKKPEAPDDKKDSETK